jgi:putative transposase
MVRWAAKIEPLSESHCAGCDVWPLGLVPCSTPVESPESNGMAEAFVKTLKRDYVRVSAIPDAATALARVDSWIEDYNTVHPHSQLGYQSPREYILSQPVACPV